MGNKTLNSIRHLQQLGFTLEEIRDLYDEESHTPSVHATRRGTTQESIGTEIII